LPRGVHINNGKDRSGKNFKEIKGGDWKRKREAGKTRGGKRSAGKNGYRRKAKKSEVKKKRSGSLTYWITCRRNRREEQISVEKGEEPHGCPGMKQRVSVGEIIRIDRRTKRKAVT